MDISNQQLFVVALVLCTRFGQAKDMVNKTTEYYEQFSSTISPGALKIWTNEITSAERQRLTNPRAMDIIGAKHLVGAGSADRASDPPRHPGSEWLELALSIEERQYVRIYNSSNFLTKSLRIDVRDRVKQLQKEPREEARQEVQILRQALTNDLQCLQSQQSNIIHAQLAEPDDADLEAFDNLDNEIADSDPTDQIQVFEGPDPEQLGMLPERRPLHLPSSSSTANHPLRQAELTLRIGQATQYLAALRNAIAEKSFQYSHIMRSATSKGVRTRSRSAIFKITERISQYSRVYCRARAAMVRLGADDSTLNQFKVLIKEDVKASTAILDPNVPGSTTLRLSWIWETATGGSGSASTMRECK